MSTFQLAVAITMGMAMVALLLGEAVAATMVALVAVQVAGRVVHNRGDGDGGDSGGASQDGNDENAHDGGGW